MESRQRYVDDIKQYLTAGIFSENDYCMFLNKCPEVLMQNNYGKIVPEKNIVGVTKLPSLGFSLTPSVFPSKFRLSELINNKWTDGSKKDILRMGTSVFSVPRPSPSPSPSQQPSPSRHMTKIAPSPQTPADPKFSTMTRMVPPSRQTPADPKFSTMTRMVPPSRHTRQTTSILAPLETRMPRQLSAPRRPAWMSPVQTGGDTSRHIVLPPYEVLGIQPDKFTVLIVNSCLDVGTPHRGAHSRTINIGLPFTNKREGNDKRDPFVEYMLFEKVYKFYEGLVK
jgi:hypothetical protein